MHYDFLRSVQCQRVPSKLYLLRKYQPRFVREQYRYCRIDLSQCLCQRRLAWRGQPVIFLYSFSNPPASFINTGFVTGLTNATQNIQGVTAGAGDGALVEDVGVGSRHIF